MWESFWLLFFFPLEKKTCFVPGGLLHQNLGMMSSMFSLRVNLWRKKLILGPVIQLITQGRVENKGQATRTDCCAGRASSLFGCVQSGASVQETTPAYWWMLTNTLFSKCKLQSSGAHLAGAFLPLWIQSGSVTPARAQLEASFPAEIYDLFFFSVANTVSLLVGVRGYVHHLIWCLEWVDPRK